MKILKREHACLDITENGDRLVIDPGGWTEQFDDYTGVTAVVVTHVHADHLDESKILKMVENNPGLQIFCTQQVVDKLSEDWHVTVPNLDVDYEAGTFKLEFFGGMHAIIMDDRPQDQNFGVLVNDTLYYPGDSLTPCPKAHKVLAAPSVAPWLKLSEAADFIRKDSAEQVFPTHNNIVNKAGNDMLNNMLAGVAEASGKSYLALEPGQSINI